MKWALTLVTAAYLSALLVAAAVVVLLSPEAGPAGWPPGLFVVAVADLVATAVVFAWSLAFRNASFYDPYWSVAPPVIGLYWWALVGFPLDARVLLALGLVGLWSVRLTLNWAQGWQGLPHEDWRYRNLQQQTGRWYGLVSLLGIHGFHTVLVFVGCLPLYVVLAGAGGPLNPVDLIALSVGLGALALETRADLQLHRFRAGAAAAGGETSGRLLQDGVWAWCRHPNYLGEIGFWVALGLFGWAAGGSLVWTFAGALAMTGLFLGISIPMIEGKLLADKRGYDRYCERVPRLLPYGVLKRGK